jgi:hypothetical protein
MKRLLLVLISLLIMLTFSSCKLFGSKHEENTLCFARLPEHFQQEAYIVDGIGTCTDTDIVIPAEYEGLPVIAVSIYKTMDKVMLGVMSNINEVGFYENAEKSIFSNDCKILLLEKVFKSFL